MWHLVTTAVSHASITDWLLFVSGLLLILYVVGTWNYDYFHKRGIPARKPKIPFIGDAALFAFRGIQSVYDLIKEQYKQGDGHGVYGFFELTTPFFMVRDPDVLKAVTVKEFDHFMNRRSIQNDRTEPILSKNLANLKDQTWRDMRATLSPAFTTSKIKAMVPLISECGQQMTKHLRTKYEASSEGKNNQPFPVDMKDLFTRIANDVIATTAFGVGCDSHNQPENEFYTMGKKLTTFNKFRSIIFVLNLILPKLMQMLGIRFLDPKATTFFETLVHETIQEREKKGIYRPDVLQLLMQAREGKLKTEAEDKTEVEDIGVKNTQLSEDDISAQAITFFFAGFETVSIALCLTTHLLSHHPNVQKRLYEEIEDVMEKTGGKLNYESVQGMKYLDAVVNESLRVYPPAAVADRMCREDCQLPATENCGPINVKKGQLLTIPIIGLHHDPKYWENPEEFNPDRFSDENKHKIKPFTYMPFGAGPRICIAQRFALMEVKTVLVYLLFNFELFASEKTKHPLQFEAGFNVKTKEGFWCELKPQNI